MEPLPGASSKVVAGHVRLETGRGAVGVVVTLEDIQDGLAARVRDAVERARAPRDRAPAAAAEPPGIEGLRATVTDVRGWFAFDAVQPGAYLVASDARDHLGASRRIEVPSIAEVETTYVDLDLTPTGTFAGVATLENATNHQSTVVYVEGTSYVAVTAPSGRYDISDVPVGTWTLRATHPGYLDRSTSGTILAAGDSVVVPSMVLPLDSNLPPIADAQAPASAVVGIPTQLTGTGNDLDGVVVRYDWDFEDDGVFDFSSPSSAAASHVYPAVGVVRAKLRVTDDDGAIGLDVVTFEVLDTAVYVSVTTGAPGNPGTRAAPVASIAEGIALAQPSGRPLAVAVGTYNESVVLASGVDIFGGFDPGTWLPSGSGVSRIVGGMRAVQGTAVSGVEMQALVIESADATSSGASSYGVFLTSCQDVAIVNCTITAGNGAAGVPGQSGQAGQGGGNGGSGSPGCENGTAFCSTCSAPPPGVGGVRSYLGQPLDGGLGGTAGLGPGNGGAGGSGFGSGPGAGGFGGTCDGACGVPCSDGQPGAPGSPGTNGFDGAGGAPFGTGSAGGYAAADGTAGASGGAGSGGGGGGGGHGGDNSCDSYGSSGGGGGAGGTPGTGGTGGTGGGGSFAVWALGCTNLRVEGCTLRTGSGGSGGAGGTDGTGGPGGAGGPGGPYGGSSEQDDGGCGARGGDGGPGGNGGHGGGGGGGPSIGISLGGSTGSTLLSNNFELGLPGAGGTSGGNSGSAGVQQTVRP